MPCVEILLIGFSNKMIGQQRIADYAACERKEVHVSVGIACDEGDSRLSFEFVRHQSLSSD